MNSVPRALSSTKDDLSKLPLPELKPLPEEAACNPSKTQPLTLLQRMGLGNQTLMARLGLPLKPAPTPAQTTSSRSNLVLDSKAALPNESMKKKELSVATTLGIGTNPGVDHLLRKAYAANIKRAIISLEGQRRIPDFPPLLWRDVLANRQVDFGALLEDRFAKIIIYDDTVDLGEGFGLTSKKSVRSKTKISNHPQWMYAFTRITSSDNSTLISTHYSASDMTKPRGNSSTQTSSPSRKSSYSITSRNKSSSHTQQEGVLGDPKLDPPKIPTQAPLEGGNESVGETIRTRQFAESSTSPRGANDRTADTIISALTATRAATPSSSAPGKAKRKLANKDPHPRPIPKVLHLSLLYLPLIIVITTLPKSSKLSRT